MARSDIKTPLVQAAVITGVSLALGILFERLFFGKEFSLSFPVYVVGIAVGLLGLAYYLRRKLSRDTLWLMLPFVGFASMVAVRSSDPLTLMNLGACLLLLLLMARVAFLRRLTDMRVTEYLAIPFLPLKFLGPAGHTLGRIVATHKGVRTKPMTGKIIRGILLTLPVLIVFAALFASADLIVHKYIVELIDIQIDPQLVARLVLILMATFALVAGYSYTFGATEREEAAAEGPQRLFIGKVESTILLASVNVLFFAFILVQLAYLFGGQANISAQGFTYAEYARKGFFELLAVAVVAFGLLWTAEKYVERTARGHSRLFKVLASALVLQVILIMGSAFKRLYLYEQAYGFTTLRLYSHAFTVVLAVIFIILAYKIIRSASDQAFAFPALLAVIAFLATLNAINPDAFIARQNISRYQETGKIDAGYLSRLSNDAVPVLVDEYSSLKADDATVLGTALNRRRVEPKPESAQGWESWNLSRSTADAALAGAAAELQKY